MVASWYSEWEGKVMFLKIGALGEEAFLGEKKGRGSFPYTEKVSGEKTFHVRLIYNIWQPGGVGGGGWREKNRAGGLAVIKNGQGALGGGPDGPVGGKLGHFSRHALQKKKKKRGSGWGGMCCF